MIDVVDTCEISQINTTFAVSQNKTVLRRHLRPRLAISHAETVYRMRHHHSAIILFTTIPLYKSDLALLYHYTSLTELWHQKICNSTTQRTVLTIISLVLRHSPPLSRIKVTILRICRVLFSVPLGLTAR